MLGIFTDEQSGEQGDEQCKELHEEQHRPRAA